MTTQPVGELQRLRKRVRNQRQALRTLNRHIIALNLRLVDANRSAFEGWRRYSELSSRKYKTRAWKLWVWWRNRVVWRLGMLSKANRQHWQSRYYYDRGVKETAVHVFKVPQEHIAPSKDHKW